MKKALEDLLPTVLSEQLQARSGELFRLLDLE
jgi:hypothetical protein